ncbi:hypothetical protein RJI07_03720 [Mycoplasmatota bacterium WC30]
MRNFMLSIKKRLVLIVAILLLGFSLFFSYTMFNSMGYFNLNQQTIVGTIYLENIDELQYASFISSEINDWKNKSTYKVNYQGHCLDIDLSYFDLEIDSTISGIERGQSNKVIFSISDASKVMLLSEFFNTFLDNIIDLFDLDTFLETINIHLEDMNIFKTYNLEDFIDQTVSETIIDTVTITNLDLVDVNNITNTLEQLVVAKDDRFSILDKCEDLILTNNQLSIIASGIQKITLNTPFNGYIFEQNITAPVWSLEGLNVRVLKTNDYDFSFYNPLDFDYVINIEKVSDSSVSLELVGYPFSTKYLVTKTDESVLAYSTLYYDNELLDETTENIIITDDETETTYRLLEQSGIDGKVVVFTKTSTKPDSTITTEIIYREIYFPTPEIFQENIIPKAGE